MCYLAVNIQTTKLFGTKFGWTYRGRSLSTSTVKIFSGFSEVAEDFIKSLVLKSCGETSEKLNFKNHTKLVTNSEAQRLFTRGDSLKSKPTKYALCDTLSYCAKTLDGKLALRIHAHMIRCGFEENVFLNSALINFYAKCGAIVDARKVFDGMKMHDEVSWTSLISGFSQIGQGRDACLKFKEMFSTEIKPNCVTYVSVISACLELEEALELVSSLHAHVVKFGFNCNSFVASSLVDCYAKWGMIDFAVLLFYEITDRDTILYNSMITGYSQNQHGEDAYLLFSKMMKNNLRPDDHTLTSTLKACSGLCILMYGRQMHSLIIKVGSEGNVFVCSALIDMYSKCGDVDEARTLFDQTFKKNNVLWTSMITCYAQSGRAEDALELFECLLAEERLIPDRASFSAALVACNRAGLLDKGVEYFTKMRSNYGMLPDLGHYACIIELYARNDNLKKARNLIEEMPYAANHVVWSSFLSFCNAHGNVELAKEAADRLLEMEPCNSAHYLTLAQSYARIGQWTKAAEVRNLIQQKGIKKQAGWSLVETGKEFHVFTVGDTSHSQTNEIYAALEKIYLGMNETEYSLNCCSYEKRLT